MNNLIYRDVYITIFFDEEKCMVVMLNSDGKTKVINVDDNFYSVEEDVIAYFYLLNETKGNEEEKAECLKAFVDYTKESLDKEQHQALNKEYLEVYGIPKEAL